MQKRARNRFASVRMSMSENISARQQTLFKSADYTLSAVNAQMIRVHLLFGCTLAVLWSRWKEEYLTLLQQRSKWRTPKPGLVVDDFALVKDENLPPMKWPLARVIELLFGGDGVARVAVLKTASGVTKRAVNKLCLLPLKDDVEKEASNGGSMSGHAAAAAN